MRRAAYIHLLAFALAAVSACGRAPEPDAYGNVEADKVLVAAEVGGVIESLAAVEGQRLAKGAVAAVIDVSQLALEQQQLEAQRAGSAARSAEVAALVDVARQRQAVAAAERDVLTAQRAIATRQYERTKRLFDQQAATAQQLDQAERDLRTLQEQIDAQTRRIAAEREQVDAAQARAVTARQEVRSAAARLAQIGDRLEDAQVRNPIDGTVLTTLVEAGEVVQPGQGLYEIARLDLVDVRAYITETQLSSVRLGQPVTVTFDAGGDTRRTLPGTVAWISAEAEFTPTPVQTRDERTGLVYAVTIRVPNEQGALKIGMPVDVDFASGAR